jgi:hypothetical protein
MGPLGPSMRVFLKIVTARNAKSAILLRAAMAATDVAVVIFVGVTNTMMWRTVSHRSKRECMNTKETATK